MKQESDKNPAGLKPKEVVYVWNYLEWGGAQVYFIGIASRIMDRTKVRFVFPRGTNRQFFGFCEERGIPYDFLDSATDNGTAATLRRKLERHWRKVRSERETLAFLTSGELPDIVHVEFGPWQSLFVLMALCRRTNVFVTMHNALPAVGRWRKMLWKIKFGIITRHRRFNLFASNKHARESLAPYLRPSFLERVRVTYTNVNPDEIDVAGRSAVDKSALRAAFGLPADKLLVVCLGQFIDRKGRWIFLEAARSVRDVRDDIAFAWIANNDATVDELNKINGFGLGDSFTLLKSEAIGHSHLDLMKFLRIADIFSLPSLVEGLPISLLEAMALGVPSVSTNVYAIPEAVEDEVTGILIEAGDAAGLAAAIVKLADDRELREKLGQAGRERVLRNFNEKKVAEIAFDSYCEAYRGTTK